MQTNSNYVKNIFQFTYDKCIRCVCVCSDIIPIVSE